MAWYRTGTASVSSGSAAVTGTTTGWLSQAKAGDGITFDNGGKWYEIAAVNSNTSITLASNFGETTVSGGAYAIDKRSPLRSLTSELYQRVSDLIEKATHILTGAGAPISTDGVDGDVWIRTSPLTFYGPKAAGAWPSGITMTGQGVATGGTDGQALVKDGSVNYATKWAPIRPTLSGTINLYVRKDGSDSNSGLADTAGGAVLTIQKAVDLLAAIDIAGFSATINVRAGTYAEAVSLKALVGGPCIIVGDETTPSNIIISTTGNQNGFALSQYSLYHIRGMRFENTGATTVANAITALSGEIQCRNLDFGPSSTTAGRHITVQGTGSVRFIGNYTISGSCQMHWVVSESGVINCAGRDIKITGAPNFATRFAWAAGSGVLNVNANRWGSDGVNWASTAVGLATGTRYKVETTGSIYTNGAGSSYLPGSTDGTSIGNGIYV